MGRIAQIKMLMPELKKSKGKGIEKLLLLREELNEKAGNMTDEIISAQEIPAETLQIVPVEKEYQPIQTQEDKIIQFQEIIKNVVLDALQENNVDLQKEMGRQVSDHVIKEVDYIMRVQDEKDEERFKKLDETIRNYQKSRQEVAITQKEEKKRFHFRKKQKKASK